MMNRWIGSSIVLLVAVSVVGCGEKDTYIDVAETIRPQNINSFTKDNPSSGGIMNELTLTKLKMAQMRSVNETTDKSIATIKQTFVDFNYVVLEFERRKKSEGGSLHANDALLDQITYDRCGMSHNELTIAVNQAVKKLDNM